jgi:hypothetical protein
LRGFPHYLDSLWVPNIGNCDENLPKISGSVGREIGLRYGWRKSENVTQQDGFFVSPSSLIGVELKLGSVSWAEQVAKYAALMV